MNEQPTAPLKAMPAPVEYIVAGRKFIVEPVFKDRDEAAPTLPSILLNLMTESN